MSPTGPTSIIISTGDQRVVVLRNGIEIGRAKAVVQQQLDEAQVMTLTKARGGKSEWIQVGVSSLAKEDADIVSTQGIEQMQPPRRLRRQHAGDHDPGNDRAGDPGQRRRTDHRPANHRPRVRTRSALRLRNFESGYGRARASVVECGGPTIFEARDRPRRWREAAR